MRFPIRSLLTLSFLTLSLSWSFTLSAAVWEDTQSWSMEYEQKYSQWMRSTAVREAMFTDRGSPYYGANPDCADAAYALRAIFAFENKLPFAITNPSGSRTPSKTLNNRSNKWDHAGSEVKRLLAMIAEIGESVGTENLSHFDTFPVAIKSVAPGTLYTYKIKARFGKFIRHTYSIKDINPVGTFDVIYSTQANQERHGELLRRRDREFENAPVTPWGFKKFRWPEHLNTDLANLPKDLGPSNEQYNLASTMGEREFFKFVKKTLATTNETAGERLTRSFKAVCTEAQARIEYVNQALEYLKTNSSCMDYQKFDAFSTPARDAALKELFEKLKQAYNDAQELKGPGQNIDPQMFAFAEYIFKGKGSVQSELLAACPINYRPSVSIDLQTLWSRMEKDRLSSHPNDIVEVRWGEKTSPLTKCKRWY